jgi:hypothetical protein
VLPDGSSSKSARAKKLLSEKEINDILDPARMTEPVRPLDSAASGKK